MWQRLFERDANMNNPIHDETCQCSGCRPRLPEPCVNCRRLTREVCRLCREAVCERCADADLGFCPECYEAVAWTAGEKSIKRGVTCSGPWQVCLLRAFCFPRRGCMGRVKKVPLS